jgi:4'-phosphopantetheinyl transferase EntD
MLQSFLEIRIALATMMSSGETQRVSGPWPLRRVEGGVTNDERVSHTLFGRGVEFELVDPSAVSLADIDPLESRIVANAVASRQRQFAAGRLGARRLLARLGLSAAPLLADADRLPCWPEGIVGSISHVDELCGVVVARRADVAGVGFDIEHALDLPADAWRVVLTEGERAMLARVPEHERGVRARLIFSAKESFYKCYRSGGGGWLDFSEVELRPVPDTDDIEVRVRKHLWMSAANVEGRYAVTPRFIFTAFIAR